MRLFKLGWFVAALLWVSGVAWGQGTKQGTNLTEIQRVDLVKRWFQSPYEYMFGSGTTKVLGKNYGMFTGGIRGLMYYGGINHAAAHLIGVKKRSYMDLSPIEKLAGIQALTSGIRAVSFKRINPRIVEWGARELVPNPKSMMGMHTMQALYNKIFSRFFRMMAESYVYLKRRSLMASASKSYMAAVQSGKDGLSYLQQKYDPIFTHYGRGGMTPGMAVGFWLRRYVDGSEQALWSALGQMMARYDAQWFLSVKGKMMIQLAQPTVRQLGVPVVQPRNSGKAGISESDRLAVAEKYFAANADSYAFRMTGPQLQIGKRSLGMYIAGISGSLYYSRWSFVLRQHFAKTVKGGAAMTLEALSGLKMFLKKPKNWHLAKSINPKMVEWAAKNLVPQPTSKVGGQTCQAIYDRVYSRMFRVMALSYLYLRKHNLLASESAAYLRYVAVPGQSGKGVEYLNTRFKNVLSYYQTSEAYVLNAPLALGFWLRRQGDGSINTVWSALEKFLKRYDRDWIEPMLIFVK